MDTRQRRNLIATQPNAGTRHDYIVTLRGRSPQAEGRPAAGILLRYIPDRLLLEPESLAIYLEALAEHLPGRLEHLAVTVLEDVNDELVARWLHVSAAAEEAGHRIGEYRVDIEDRQPRWDNARLLARLERF